MLGDEKCGPLWQGEKKENKTKGGRPSNPAERLEGNQPQFEGKQRQFDGDYTSPRGRSLMHPKSIVDVLKDRPGA